MMDRDAHYGFSDLERKLNAQLGPMLERLAKTEEKLESLNHTVAAIPQSSFAEITNLLDNSHPEYSVAAFTTLFILPTDVTDLNRQCYNWYRQLRADTELVDIVDNALKAEGHSMFAAAEGANADIPRWDIEHGEVPIGGTAEQWDICFRLPADLVIPGLTFYFQFEAKLATMEPVPADLQFFAGFYDNTLGARDYIEGGTFTITGEIFGATGAENVSYQVKAFTDSGEEAISNVLAFTNAVDMFTQNDHPRINFRGAPGFIKFEIYRLKDGVYTLQGEVRNAIESTFFDTGGPPIREVVGFPGATSSPRAFAKTRTFEPGSLSTDFRRQVMTILVPTTYDSSATEPGQQWLRMGLTDLVDTPGQIIIRRLGLALGHGMWSRSPNDSRFGAHSPRTVTPVSSGQGGSGTPIDPPPPEGSGGKEGGNEILPL